MKTSRTNARGVSGICHVAADAVDAFDLRCFCSDPASARVPHSERRSISFIHRIEKMWHFVASRACLRQSTSLERTACPAKRCL